MGPLRLPRRVRLGPLLLRVLGVFAAVLLLILLFEAELDTPTRRSRRGPGRFRVLPGASLRGVTEALADSGWVREPLLPSIWGRQAGLDRKIRPGRYRVPKGSSPREVIIQIAAGKVETTRITIPEGWREARILDTLADSLEVPRAAVQTAAMDSSWVRSLGIPRPSLEGYLFPETYIFPKEYDARAAIKGMVHEADLRFDSAMQRRAAQLGWERDAVVTLASIVQAEAAKPSEMPRIAAVFHNRLRQGWKLEADPTVLYALGRITGPVLYKDLEVASPYNTYRARGLPPGPIGNPGTDALRAVLWPDSTRDEWYFVAKGNGEHTFSRTLAQHNTKRRTLRSAAGRGR